MVVEWVRASADQPAFLLEELPVGLPERGLDVGVGGAAVAGHGGDVARGHHVHLQVTLDHRHGDAQLRVFAWEHNIYCPSLTQRMCLLKVYLDPCNPPPGRSRAGEARAWPSRLGSRCGTRHGSSL